MNFRDIIEEISRKDPAMTSGAVVGSDGLTVEEWHAGGDRQDLSALCAEAVQFFRESDRISGENGLGTGQEAAIEAERGRVFIQRVTGDYLILIVTSNGSIPGRCRFLLKQAARKTREIL